MLNVRLARLIKLREFFKCEMCGKIRLTKMYEYRNCSFVKGYIPRHFREICGNCIYKECYGSNAWKKKKKEGTLDDM